MVFLEDINSAVEGVRKRLQNDEKNRKGKKETNGYQSFESSDTMLMVQECHMKPRRKRDNKQDKEKKKITEWGVKLLLIE